MKKILIAASVIVIIAAAVALADERNRKPANDPAKQTASCDVNACPDDCCTASTCKPSK